MRIEPMPDATRATCQGCGKHKSEAGPISWSGLCLDCSVLNLSENIASLGTKTGYPYRHWKHAMKAWAAGLDLDEPPLSPQTGEAHA